MTRKLFVTVTCGLLLVTSMFAQSRGVTADPISGAWTGELVRQSASSPIPITMQLKFDGKKAVSGTVSGLPSPAEVKAGTFDPKTGALKLELGKIGESEVLLVFQGTVVKGTATGSVSGDIGNAEFKIVKKV